MFFADRFDFVPALFEASLAATIETEHGRADLSKIQRIERVIEKKHLRFGAVSFAPTAFLSDHRTRHREAVYMIYVMESHGADDFIIASQNNCKDYISIFSRRQSLVPRDLAF